MVRIVFSCFEAQSQHTQSCKGHGARNKFGLFLQLCMIAQVPPQTYALSQDLADSAHRESTVYGRPEDIEAVSHILLFRGTGPSRENKGQACV